MKAQEIFAELQSLDPQNPGSWPLFARIGAAILAAIFIIGIGYWQLIMPKLEDLDRASSEENTLFEEFERKQRKVAALDAYKLQLQEMEKTFGAMLRQLPSKTEVPNLLNDISQTRVASSLEEELFKPQPDIPKEFYAEVPNQIVVIGTYHEMGAFVSGIAALPRIVTVDEVDIKPFEKKGASKGGKEQKDPNSTDGGVLLRMQALAKTYRYLDDTELAAQEAAKAAKNKPKGAPVKQPVPAAGAKK